MTKTESVTLCITFLLYFVTAFVWPSWRILRTTGRNPYVLAATDDAHGFVASGMRAVMVGLLAYIVVQTGWPHLEPAMGVIPWLVNPAVRAAGWAGLLVAIIWTIVAQYQMGQSWRIGIDTKHRTGLVTSGLFSRSRNPIFLAMRLCLFSLVLIRPNAVTVALWLVGDVLMQFQVRLEEAFLREHHGAEYAAYASRVRRWI